MNAQRGEIALALAGRTIALCPSFAALVALEEASGTGLVTLARRFADGSFSLSDIEAVIAAGMKGAGQTPPADLGDQILQTGIATLAPRLGEFLLAALGGVPAPGKP